MHLPLLISLFAVTNRVTAGQFLGIKRTSNTGAVHDYLDRLAPVSKNTILHELMGPTVGSDVGSHLPADHPMRSILTSFFCFYTARGNSARRARS